MYVSWLGMLFGQYENVLKREAMESMLKLI